MLLHIRKGGDSMGHRANLVLVNETGYTIYYCHWCARDILMSLFWGPHTAAAYITQQQAGTSLLDEIWAEGGAIVDYRRKNLLLWTEQSISEDLPLRRLYMDLLREVWAGWTVQWAHLGVLDMADYLGIPRARVTADLREANPRTEPLRDIVDAEELRTLGGGSVASFRFEDGSIRLFRMDLDLEDLLSTGPAIIALARQSSGRERLHLEAVHMLPQCGFHIDVAARELAYWLGHRPEQVAHLSHYWDGWNLTCLNDDFEAHVRLTDGRLTYAFPPVDAMLAHLQQMLMDETTSDYLDNLIRFATSGFEDGQQVWVNPRMFGDKPLATPRELRAQILDEAIASWRKKGRSALPTSPSPG